MSDTIHDEDVIIKTNKIHKGGISYNYSLSENKSRKMPSFGLPLYTLKIEMIDSDGVSTMAMAKDIFRDVDKALCFYDKIVRNLATPIDLAYVVEDEIG